MAFLRRSLGVLHQRCPRCMKGAIYRCGIDMHVRCPVCDLQFEPEPGYFLGAMYISYAMATILMGSTMFLLHLVLPDWDLGVLVLLAAGVFIPFVPMVSRYSRVIWMYLDNKT